MYKLTESQFETIESIRRGNNTARKVSDHLGVTYKTVASRILFLKRSTELIKTKYATDKDGARNMYECESTDYKLVKSRYGRKKTTSKFEKRNSTIEAMLKEMRSYPLLDLFCFRGIKQHN